MPSFTINRRTVGDGAPAYFIADIAANHDGSLSRALDLINLAADAGADCVKFQHFTADEIVSDRGFTDLGKLSHQASWQTSVHEAYRQASLPRDWTPVLAKQAQLLNVDFMSTPYDLNAVAHLAPYVPAYKIGSGDITYLDLLTAVAKQGKPVLLATGASSTWEVTRSVSLLDAHQVPVAVMQCLTDYTGAPESIAQANLRVLSTWRKSYPNAVLGLSDHTPGHLTVLGAVALGASVIEKHFTDDTFRTGPDHHFSMTPKTWRDMVDATRSLESALGDGTKRVETSEADTVVIQRRGLRAARDLPRGHVIGPADLVFLRPATPGAFTPWDADLFIGRQLAADIPRHACLTKVDLV